MEKLNQFWYVATNIWKDGLYGIDIGRIIIAILIFSIFLILRQLFTRFIIKRIIALSTKTKTDIDEITLKALEKPLGFTPVVLGLFFAFDYLQLGETFKAITDNIIRTLIVFILFWSLIKIVDILSDTMRSLEKFLTASMVDWLIKMIKASFIFIGIATALQIWGIQVGPILAGLGLFGVAVALGAQDLFKNLISGILIIGENRFSRGDWIKVDGVVEGTVETIGFRSTLVRRFDKAPVYVPNSSLSDNSVTNFSAMTHRRIRWCLGVKYNTTIDQLRQIRDNIEQYLLSSNQFAKPPEVPMFVRIDNFSDSAINIMVYCFTKTTIWGDWLAIKEALAYEIKKIIENAGSEFAFPSRSLYVEAHPDETAEIFIPPSKKKDEPDQLI
ncbi:MAG: mechanosensitive ion channel [Desulfobacteraceae bacterium]|nr:mechanosensitive ion channel [Desulfobacteraceae bacterium]